MKPLISYYGGKQRIASKIAPYLLEIPHKVYVEPFCGGGAVFYARPKVVVGNRDDYRECLNDLSDNLITFYRVAKERPKELLKAIDGTLYSQSEHRKSIEVYKKPQDYDDLTRAWAYFVNANQSFAKSVCRGWGASVKSENSAATWDNRKSRLQEQLDKLKDVHVSCEDALRCIKRWDSPQTLFYLDPPYPGANQGHYSGYTLDDWQQLLDLLDSIQGSYVLSNYPQELQPKSAQRRIEIEATMSAAKSRADKRDRTEVLWICDRSLKEESMGQSLLFA